jgi:periplasmic protein TonB
MLFRTLVLISVAASATNPALSQQPAKLKSQEILQLVDHRVEPVYPPIAKAARISGTVVLAVVVSSTGKLESWKVVSGPAMLQ